MPFPFFLTGQTRDHLCSPDDAEIFGVYIHCDVVTPFRKLQAQALRQGFDLQILSGFRSFEDQLSIWNRKADGKLAVLDSNAQPLDIDKMSKKELVMAILRWSALPGTSRHHWGTDLDVFDAKARPQGYDIECIPEEVEGSGMFAPLHDWLDQHMTDFGFFRPYDCDRGGVACERWHLSFAPISEINQNQFTVDLMEETVRKADIRLKQTLLENLEEIRTRFVDNTCRMDV